MRILILLQKKDRSDLLSVFLAKNFIIDEVYSENDFFEKFYLYDYDLVIIRPFLSSLNLGELIAEIKTEKPKLPIIYLAQNDTSEALQKYLNMQINAILHFPSLLKTGLATANDSFGSLNFDFTKNCFLIRDRALDLPKRELILLRKLFFNRHQFLSRTEIAKFLLKDCYTSNSNLIDVYVYRLRKLLRKNFPEIKIKYYHALGYKISHCN